MPGITGMGLTFNLPNFVGELFELTPSDTPLLSAIGGVTGGDATTSTEFQWQEYDLRDAGQNTKVEGAPAPTAQARVRENVTNVVQIHQETVDVSYTKEAATGQYAGANIAGTNPVMSELQFQTQAALKHIARDVEFSFIRGQYQKPDDNTTPRKTRGVLEAIATNVITNSTATALTQKMVLDLLQKIWDNGGIKESETATVIVNSYQKRMLTKLFVTDAGYQEASRNVGGVSLQTFETDFGKLNIMLNRHMPADTLAVVSLEMLKPKFLMIPGKGFMFIEELAKTGASTSYQIYGEIGLQYGNERAHGKITGLEVVSV